MTGEVEAVEFERTVVAAVVIVVIVVTLEVVATVILGGEVFTTEGGEMLTSVEGAEICFEFVVEVRFVAAIGVVELDKTGVTAEIT